jgi:hypothetical protein
MLHDSAQEQEREGFWLCGFWHRQPPPPPPPHLTTTGNSSLVQCNHSLLGGRLIPWRNRLRGELFGYISSIGNLHIRAGAGVATYYCILRNSVILALYIHSFVKLIWKTEINFLSDHCHPRVLCRTSLTFCNPVLTLIPTPLV